MQAPPPRRRNPLTRSPAGIVGLCFLAGMLLACLLSLPWTLGRAPARVSEGGAVAATSPPRYNDGDPRLNRLPPPWARWRDSDVPRLHASVPEAEVDRIVRADGIDREQALAATSGPVFEALREHWRQPFLGTDALGRSLLTRLLAGGGISLGIGIAAATISVCIGTLYGALAGWLGGRIDNAMMRVVDILYGLPYVLLVVLLAVASDAMVSEFASRTKARAAWVQQQAIAQLSEQPQDPRPARQRAQSLLAADPALREQLEQRALEQVPPRQISQGTRTLLDLVTLLVAIGGVSWLTMARVVRGQVLSLKQQPFMEAARAMGLPTSRIFLRHLLPNLVGVIVVYATLTVPQAILQESFLSFLGIGVKPPLPSWGNLAAEGLPELNPYQSNWWLLLFPCLLLGLTLLALNFVGEALREALDPKGRTRA